MNHSDRLIINYTPTGMVPTRALTPHVPLSVPEIIEDVHKASELGITIAHLHARDSIGRPTYKGEIFEELISGIRRFAPDLVICVSLSGRAYGEFDKRAEPLTLDGYSKPDMGSLTLSSLNFCREASLNSPEMVSSLAAEMNNRGILPELEVFDLGMVNQAKYLISKNLLQPPHYFNVIVGNISSAQFDLLHIGTLLKDLPPQSYWALGGIGDSQLGANALGIATSGGVRIGLEDNIYFDRGRNRLATNHALLNRVHEMAAVFERAVMKPSEFRSILNLERGFGRYGRRLLRVAKAVNA